MCKQILITGGAGFIGSNFAERCLEKGDHVVIVDSLTYAGCEDNLTSLRPKENYIFIRTDIRNQPTILEILKKHNIEVIVNFAAETHVDNSIADPKKFLETNIIGTYELLEASLKHYTTLPIELKNKFKYLQISTDEVFGTLSLDDPKFNEKSQIRPNSPYSASKAAADHLVRSWFHTYKLPVITTHCSNNYGPKQHEEKLIPNIIQSALSGKPITIYGDGKNIRDWLYVKDYCEGIYQAIDCGIRGESYCFGGNSEVNNINLATQICNTLENFIPSVGRKYRDLIKFVADRPGHDFRYAIDDLKAVSELGFVRTYNLDQGLNETIQWYVNKLHSTNIKEMVKGI